MIIRLETMGLLLAVLAGAGCVGSQGSPCPWGTVCPSESVCHAPTETCVPAIQVSACE